MIQSFRLLHLHADEDRERPKRFTKIGLGSSKLHSIARKVLVFPRRRPPRRT